jgi:acyl-CoA reductase-like NAD-dependent aldehyde dehydrogenase
MATRKLTPGERAHLRAVIDRCHIGQSNAAVIRYVVSRLARKYDSWRALPRAMRREMMRETVRQHERNRDLFMRVARGIY